MNAHDTFLPKAWRKALGLLSIATMWTLQASAQPPQPSTPPAAVSWVHEQVKQAPDPSVRFGQLPNGLRYALKFNGIEANGIAFRLRIGAGSLRERDGEQGFAHFLEHMAFRGSRHVPDGEVTHILQRQGLAFGPDSNAYTMAEQTVYRFDFPRGDATAVQTGLMLFREIADRLTLAPDAIEQEKGVVLSEERVSDLPQERLQRVEMAQVFAGTAAADRPPVGAIDTVKAITAERLRRFYEAYYRPNNATLVIVGYFDVDAVERKIREQFGDWQGAATASADMQVALGSPPSAAEFVAEGAPELISLTWRSPADLRMPTPEVERQQLVDQMAVAIVNSRLKGQILKVGSPAVLAVASWQSNALKLASLAKIVAVPSPGQWQGAMDQVTAVLRRLLTDGVSEADVRQIVPAVHAEFKRAVEQANTLSSAPIADAIVQADLNGAIYRSAWQTLQTVEPILRSIGPEEVTVSLRRVFGGEGPVVLRSAPAGAVGTSALTAQLERSMRRVLTLQDEVQAAGDWPYRSFGEPSEVTGTLQDATLDTTTVRFANDTRLIVKTTPFDRDQVVVQVNLGQGLSGMQPPYLHTLGALEAFPLGGTAKWPLAQFLGWLESSGKRLSVQLRLEPHAFVLQGTTRRADLLTQLQVLAAFARDPGFRPELDEKLAAALPMALAQRSAQAGFVFEREFTRLMTGGERRLASTDLPDAADVQMSKPGDVAAVLREPLAGAADVVIVGDVSAADAIAAVQATFGAGPGRHRPTRLTMEIKSPPDPGSSHSFTHAGRRDQGMLGWAWPTPDFWADRGVAAATGAVAAAVLRARLEETVRGQLGITYTPQVEAYASTDVVGRGHLKAAIETSPDKFETFRQLLRAQLKALAAKPVSEDELARARRPIVEAGRRALHSNNFWLFWLPRLLDEPRAKDAALNEVNQLESVTSAQVHRYFRDRIENRMPIELTVQARSSPGAASNTLQAFVP